MYGYGYSQGCAPVQGSGFGTNYASILVIFILLVIILCAACPPARGC